MSNSEPTHKKSNVDGVSPHNDHHACTPTYSVPLLKTPNKNCGIINKVNTCYANVILQCLKVFPVLWSSSGQIKSTLYSSVRKVMFQLHSAKSPVDPFFFLKSLKDVFVREGRSFDLHDQQDVGKVLEIVLEELTGPSFITSAAYNIKSLTSTICHTCHQLNRTGDILPILRLPVLKDFPALLAKDLETESLIGSNGVTESDSKVSLTSVGNCLIVQLNRFFVSNGTVTKNSASSPIVVSSLISHFVSSPIQVVAEIEDEVFCARKFNLAAVINHSGNLNSAHYTCLVQDGETWWHCNDKAVVQVNLDDINKSMPNVLFYQAK